MPSIPLHHTDTSAKSWDGPENDKQCPTEKAPLRESHAWADPEGDAATKAAYRFIHHEVSADGVVGAANIKACQTGIGVLNGGMGGTTIPDADRKGVYRHLAAHLKDADVEVPELKFLLPSAMEKKELQFELKQLNEDGTFEGVLATYGNLDLSGDIIEPGAFDKTLKDNKGKVPLLWQHKVDEPIGLLTIKDTPQGLIVNGVLDLNVQRAREAYSLMKKGIVKGLSIGFESMRDAIENGIRHLKELRLWEGSAVTFPCNLRALITAVKSRIDGKQADDFASELQQIQLYAARWQMMQALCCVLDDMVHDHTMSANDKVAASQSSIQQFEAAYVALLPDYLSLLNGDMEMMHAPKVETKAGRMLSSSTRDTIDQCIVDLNAVLAANFVTTATRTTIEKCITDLKALISAADAAEAAAKSATPGTAPPATAPVETAANQPTEPGESHSVEILAAFDGIRSLFAA